MGSRWYVKHPIVPLKSIVAVLNGDMMGRKPVFLAAILIFLAGSALILLCSGALAELIYARGDVRDREFLKLTQTILSAKRNPEPDRAL